MRNEPPAARCQDLVKVYRTATSEVRALRGISAGFERGSVTAVVGPSGSGKSSLLRLLAGLDRATDGQIEVDGLAMRRASSGRLRRLRRDVVGYLFQRPSDNFLPHLTVGEHTQLVTLRSGAAPSVDPMDLLELLGIEGRAHHLPAQLSGGEQQRAAVAQVLAGGARIVLADEPTSELDTASGAGLLEAIGELATSGITFVIATHDSALRRTADSVLELDHGLLKERAHPVAAGALAHGVPASPWREPGEAGGPPFSKPNLGLPLLEARGLTKSYGRGDEVVHAVRDVGLAVHGSQLVGVVGRSGSGKTTLLNLLGGWERPDHGTVVWPGTAATAPGWDVLAVVPQRFGLLDELTVRENVEFPALLAGRLEEARETAEDLMETLGLSHLEDRFPRETSVGEQQRSAVARALVLSPALVLADEPIGHQDAGWTAAVFDALGRAASSGTSCLVATHNREVTTWLDRVLEMSDGRLSEPASA